MTDLEIKLTFHTDSPTRYPAGYWVAEAGRRRGLAEWDGVGATPLDAMTSLAQQMYRALYRGVMESEETTP